MKEMMISTDTNGPVFYSHLKPERDHNNNNSYVSINNGLKPFLMDNNITYNSIRQM
jgi:hypothetical protein